MNEAYIKISQLPPASGTTPSVDLVGQTGGQTKRIPLSCLVDGDTIQADNEKGIILNPDYTVSKEEVANLSEKTNGISVEKISSPNLFDKDSVLNKSGYYSASGFSQSDSYNATHPILIKANTRYKIDKIDSSLGGGSVYWAKVEEDGTIISVYRGGVDYGSYVIFSTASEGYYSFNTGLKSNVGLVMVCVDSEWPSEYRPYIKPTTIYKLESVLLDEVSLKTNFPWMYSNKLFGKSVVFDGDSISAGVADDGRAWGARIAEKNNMLFKNFSVGGGTITYGTTLPGGANRHWVSGQIDNIISLYPNIDYLILEGGVNDADVLDEETQFGVFDPTDFSGNYDRTTYVGALDYLFYTAKNAFTGAKIGFVVIPKQGFPGNIRDKRRRYLEQAILSCIKWQIPYVDLWELCPIDPNDVTYYDASLGESGNKLGMKSFADSQHPTAFGYECFITPMVEAFMKSME